MAFRKLSTALLIVVLPVLLEAQIRSWRYSHKSYPSIFAESNRSPSTKDSSYYNAGSMEDQKMMSRIQAADANDKPEESEDNIVFPDASILQSRNRNDLFVPSCKEKNFCEDVSYYPTDLVNQLLRNNPSLQNYAIVDSVEIIEQRTDTGEEEICLSRVKHINPRSARSINDDWLFIVQSENSNFNQSIRVEICDQDDSPCPVIDGLAAGYQTKCRQKYIYRRLLALSHTGELSTELFPVPASCCCHLIKDEIYGAKRVRTTSGRDRT